METKENKEPKMKEEKIKEPKIKKEAKPAKEKKSKYPDWYIGRPKPMKTKKFEFHKPTAKTYIKGGIALAAIIFVVVIILRLIAVGNQIQPQFEYYTYEAEEGTEYKMENPFLAFELDPVTTQFTITQKSTGKVWHSNPPEAMNDPIALPKEKNKMMSPFLIKYSTITGTDDTFDIYTSSVKNKFYEIKKVGDTAFRVNYTVGDIQREYIIPLAFYESDLNKITKKLSNSDKRSMLRSYRTFTLKAIKDPQEREVMLSKYPGLADETLYLIFDTAQDFAKKKIESNLAKAGFTQEDYEHYKEIYKEESIKEVPAFNLSVIYRLDGNKFTVDIPLKEIAYRIKYPITNISILPYFGAGSTNDEGFMFVPEGGGSIINFNNGKLKQNWYYADMYGWDLAESRDAVITETRNVFPVFGLANGNSGFISVIESGSEYAVINADISGKLGTYNYVNAIYDMLHREQFLVTSRNINSQFSYEDSLPQNQKIVQSYIFVDEPSYVEMAKAYSKYLFGDKKVEQNKPVPVVVEVLGAIDKVQQIAGMPKTKPYDLTTYSQAADIIKSVQGYGIDGVRYKLSGFVNEGMRQTLLKDIDFISQMGGKSGFKKMMKELSGVSDKIYLDAAIETAYRSGMSDGFFKYKDAARLISDELCEIYEYSPIWYGREKEKDSYYLISKKLREKCVNELLKVSSKYGLNGVSFRDYGSNLSSDYNKRRPLNRMESREMQQEAMQEAAKKGLKVMINGGNDYALSYADCITNMKLHGNSYGIIDYKVPFYQMVIPGYVDYVSEPVNLAAEQIQVILESAEAGAGLSFAFTASDEKRVQETDYSQYYSTYYTRWEKDFAQICKTYVEKMANVSGAKIINHEFITADITKTTYENGYSVYVNFGYQDYSKGGLSIKARSYDVVKENK